MGHFLEYFKIVKKIGKLSSWAIIFDLSFLEIDLSFLELILLIYLKVSETKNNQHNFLGPSSYDAKKEICII